MELKNQVCNLELSKKLKELGVKQKSLFWYVKGEMEYGYEGEWEIKDGENYFLFDHIVGHTFDKYNFEVCPDIEKFGNISSQMSDEQFTRWEKEKDRLIRKMMRKVISAFTVTELSDLLKKYLENNASNFTLIYLEVMNLTEEQLITGQMAYNLMNDPDISALMIIYLLKNNLIKL